MFQGISIGIPLEQLLHLQWKTGTLGFVVGDCYGGVIFWSVMNASSIQMQQLHWDLMLWNKFGAACG